MGLRAVSPVSGHRTRARQDAPIAQEGRGQEVLHTAQKDALICLCAGGLRTGDGA